MANDVDPWAPVGSPADSSNVDPWAPANSKGEQNPISWSDVAKGAWENLPSSAGELAKNIAQPFIHPIDTATGIKNVGLGALEKAGITSGTEHIPYADAVGEFYKNRFGGIENIKHTLAEDPVGAAADLATVLTGGGGMAARVPGVVGRVGGIVGTLGSAIDPIANAARVAKPIAKVAGEGISHGLGLTTGAGAESIKQAAEAGYKGGQAAEDFQQNLRKTAPMTDVVQDAKDSVAELRRQRGESYRNSITGLKANQVIYGGIWADIANSITDMSKIGTYKGKDLYPSTRKVREQIRNDVSDWYRNYRNNPGDFGTLESFDALKKIVGDTRDNTLFGTPERKVADTVYHAIRKAIVRADPEYGRVMEGYEKATKTIREIEDTLNLKPDARIDTSLRKLQSILRNNVNTNYGRRAELAQFLVDAGAPNLMKKLAGQSLSSWTPRGLQGAGLAGELGYLIMSHGMTPASIPGAIGAATIASPRLVGEGAYYAGKAAKYVPNRNVLRALNQTGRLPLGDEDKGFAKGGAVAKGKKEKIKRDAFLYMDSNSPHFAECSKCSLYKKGVCTILAMRVQPEWSCGAFLKGPYGGQEVKNITTPEEVGLVKHKVRCENCVYSAGNTCKLYEMLNKDMPDKFALDTKIKPHACCNAQTPIEDKNRADGGRIGFADGGDPELSPEDQKLAATMTHQAEQPNPALPAINAVKDFYRGGLHDVLSGQGYQMPAWSDAVSGFFKGPEVNTALGMVGGMPTYSAAGAAASAAKAQSMQPSQWLGYLKNQPGVKAQELEHIGLEPWLNSKSGQVSKQELDDFIHSQQPQITEVRKGQTNWDAIQPYEEKLAQIKVDKFFARRDNNNEKVMDLTKQQNEVERQIGEMHNPPPVYSEYQLPGGENYGETLLTLPKGKSIDTIVPDKISEEKYLPQWNELLAKKKELEPYVHGREAVGKENYPEWLNHYNSVIDDMDHLHRQMIDDTWKRIPENEKLNYQSSHWTDPNVLLHVRHNDRVIPEKGYYVQNTKSGHVSPTFATKAEAEAYQSKLPPHMMLPENTKIMEGNNRPTKSLHLEEVQSDWHQAGRKSGYDIPVDPNNYEITGNGPWVIRNKKTGDFVLDFNNKNSAEGYLKDIHKGLILPWKKEGLVPDAPFKQTWPDLALKRMLHRAATEKNPDGSYKYDSLSWTPGQVQADRYDLSKHINRLSYSPHTHDLWAYSGQRRVLNEENVSPEDLHKFVGKDVADKIINKPTNKFKRENDEIHELLDTDLKVGGEGMKSFYDKMLVDKANALTKKYGTRVQPKQISTGYRTIQAGPGDWRVVDPNNKGIGSFKTKEEAQRAALSNEPKVWHLPITPELRKAAEGGFPTFAYGGGVLGYEDGGDVEPLSDADMAQSAAEAAAARVRAPYVRATSHPHPTPDKFNIDYNKLTGSGGEERYQLWPERIARGAGSALNAGIDFIEGLDPVEIAKGMYHSAVRGATAPRDAFTGKLQVTDPETGMPSKEAIERAMDITQLAMTGGMPASEVGALGMAGGRLGKQTTTRAEEAGLRGRGELPGGEGQLEAPRVADKEISPVHTETPLEGLPRRIKIPGHEDIEAGPHPVARQAARDYMKEAGLPYNPPSKYVKVDPENGKRIAQAFEEIKHEPDNPEVIGAYQAMADETMAQWNAIKKTGLKVDFIEGEDPYHASPRLASEDIKKNNHMWVYPTDTGFGEVGKGISKEAEAINPLLKQSGEHFGGVPARINDIFRVVHDYFGHVKEGVGFRADGEENAWRSHAAMYSPEARRAMTSETRGQNSWVNWGPHGEINRTADTPNTVFAEQKIGLLPDWAVHEGSKYITSTPPGVNKLTVNDILHPDYPVLPARSRNVTDIAEELQNRGRVALKEMGLPEKIEKPNPHSDEILSHAIASEIESAMSRSGKNAADWYTAKIQRAMELASQLHPEIATDPNMAMAYRAALAITSQGEKVTSNVRLANMVYEKYKNTGQFPTNVAAIKGKSINNNFRLLNSLINNMGPEGTRNFLSQEFTVRELKDMGYNISKEGINQKVNGSAVFGPKIGQGFYQNLSGNYDPVTMDLWFMRAWGRMTGTLKGKNPKVVAKQRERFVNELNEEGIPVPNSDEALLQKADDLVAKHEKHFFANREKYDSEEFTKSDLTKAAERYAFGFRGLNEAPSSGGQRAWMRSVVNRARELLAERGLNVTNADLQAIWWYPEKELYGKLGGRDAEAINLDYADAIADLLKQKGIPYEEGSIRPLDNGPGRGSAVNEPGGGRSSSKKGKRSNEKEGSSLPKVNRAYGGAVNEGMYRNYADGGDPTYDPTLDDAYQAQQAREAAAGRLRQAVQPEEGRESSPQMGQLGEAMLDTFVPGYSAQKALRRGDYGEALTDVAPLVVPGVGSAIKAIAPAVRPLIRGAGAFLAGTGVGAGGAFLSGESEAGEELTPLQKTLIARTPRDKRPELLKQFAAESAQRQAEQERVGREKEARAAADAEARQKLKSEIESLPEEERAMYAGFNPEQRATYWAHKAEEKRRADEQALADARAKEHESQPFLQRFPTLAKYLPAVASSAAAAIPYAIRLRQAAVANKYLREWENTAASAEHALRTGNMDEAAIHVNKLKQYNAEHQDVVNKINKGVSPLALGSSASIPFDLEFLTPNSIDALTLPPGNPAHDKAIQELTTPSEYASRAGSALVQGAVPAFTSTKVPIPGRITPPTAASMGHVATFDQRAAERAAEVAEQARLAANAAKNETRRQNMIAKAKAEALKAQAANPGWNTTAPKRTRKTKDTEEPGRAYGGRIMSHYIDHNPSEAQKKAGNYRKYHVNFHGLEIALENAKGSTRSGIDKNGKTWESTLPAHYGYVKGSTGRDGDHIDVYLGPHHASKRIFVVNQKDADTKNFEEHKAFIGFGSEPQVKSTFMKAFSDGKGKERLGHITEMTIPEFKTFLDAESGENASS